MRSFRKTHPLDGIERIKMNARSYANTYERRGKLKKQRCADCGGEKAQKHHPNYSKPLEVVWLCRKCHLKRHIEFSRSPG